eukprot:TRINITY_DN30122_c0_g1_i1.p1 TRINITY_DN30122_c0_g1~~TRINITY_DN30122_c0_g1_i1.p1  ORF type:complete len:904 (+),score=359.69 TRINITY_DN30122_c0_g1_i1:248-2713(+)
MAVLSSDFKEGKAKGLTWNLLNSFQSFLVSRQASLAPPDMVLKDRVFFRFSRQPSVSILKLALKVFRLMENKLRYREAVVRMCEDGNFKTGCDVAVGLHLFDQFSVHIFCLPLLLMDKPSTMDSYLDKSPESVAEMVSFLDYLSAEENAQRVSDLISKYPMLKPIGASKLSYKPLDRMIKKMSEKWSLDTGLYPATSIRWARGDLYYWVKQMFSLDSEQGSLQLINWRELMERKVKDSKDMQDVLVNTLLGFDVEEAKYWSNKYELGYFKNQEAEEEPDWEQDIVREESVEYYQLSMSTDRIMFVDTREQFMKFIDVISDPKVTMVGLDAEFMSSHSDQKISLLQLSTDKEAFLLDWEVLPSCLEEEDFAALATKLFARPELLIIGYGVWGDIKLLAKSFTQLSDLVTISKSILDMETLKSKVTTLLSLPHTSVRGLSGLCQSVLGLPLSKTDQISDWSRRPLRQSQLTYAALDALVCLEIYQATEAMAKERGVIKELDEMFINAMKKAVKDKKDPKNRDKVTRANLEENIPSLVEPLLTTPSPPQAMQLVCDDMLQGLCRRLRLFGVDCLALDNGQDHLECVGLATGQVPRYVLSRGAPAARIAKRLPPGHTLDIKSNDLDMQVEEVFRYFSIVADTGDLFSRCVLCNGGHYYLLDRGVLLQLADMLVAKQNRHTMEIGVDEEEEFREKEELEMDRFKDDFESDSDCEPSFQVSDYNPRMKVEEQEKRWVTVQVTSYYTGVDRVGKVNLFTGETEEGVTVQVECVARTTMEKYSQFWVCGKCGRVYFEGSHWGKATEKLKSTISQTPNINRDFLEKEEGI